MAGRLVVIGGGAAGMSAASAARRVDPELEIVVLESGGHVAYGVCGIPYYLAGTVKALDDLLAYPPDYFRTKRRLDLRLRTTVAAIEPERHLVHVVPSRGGEDAVAYDRLVVATGGRPVVPPEIDSGDPRVVTIRSLEDAGTLRRDLQSGRVRRALVVGAGYVGLEMAEALSACSVAVTVAERLPAAMPTLDASVAALVEDHVREKGVDLRLGASVEAVRPRADDVLTVVDGDELAVDLVVLATGVRATSRVAVAAGAETGPGGALTVDDRMRTSLPGVLAAGDCVAVHHLVLGRPAFVPLGPAANRTGRVAGIVAAGGDDRFHGVVGTAVVKVFELAVGRTGLTLAEARAEGLEAEATDIVGRSRAKYYPGSAPVYVRLVHERGGRLLGAQLVGTDGVAKRLDIAATALHAGLTVDDLARLDLSYAPPYAPTYDPIVLAGQAAHRAVLLAAE